MCFKQLLNTIYKHTHTSTHRRILTDSQTDGQWDGQTFKCFALQLINVSAWENAMNEPQAANQPGLHSTHTK